MGELSAKGVEVNVSDLTGAGKLAKAIPPEVYAQTSATIQSTFMALTAPLTETTAGLGRYLRQKFDSMVETERALATFAIGQAVDRARARAAASGKEVAAPAHTKTFVRTLEEAAKETDPLLHELWTNLMASQLVASGGHPHFAQILSHLSRPDAELLISLRSRDDIGPNGGGVLTFGVDYSQRTWVKHFADTSQHSWNAILDLLRTLGLIEMASRKGNVIGLDSLIIFRSAAGDDFLRAVGAISKIVP